MEWGGKEGGGGSASSAAIGGKVMDGDGLDGQQSSGVIGGVTSVDTRGFSLSLVRGC